MPYILNILFKMAQGKHINPLHHLKISFKIVGRNINNLPYL